MAGGGGTGHGGLGGARQTGNILSFPAFLHISIHVVERNGRLCLSASLVEAEASDIGNVSEEIRKFANREKRTKISLGH